MMPTNPGLQIQVQENCHVGKTWFDKLIDTQQY